MEERQKAGSGRGLKLLEKMKARSPGKLPETEPSAEATVKPSDVGIGKPSGSKPPHGRAHLLSELKAHVQKLESETPTTEVGVSKETKPETKKGRGFLAELAKQHRAAKEASITIKLPFEPRVSSGEFEAQMQELTIRSGDVEREPVIRRGEMGEKINLAVNYVALKTDPGKGVFEYDVRFLPEIDYVAFRYKLISEHIRAKISVRCYDGSDKLYVPEKLTSDRVIIEAKHPNDESPVQIILTFKQQKRLKECSQFYNILINNCSKILKLTRLGRQHYDHRLSHHVPQHKLEVWPGYVTAVEEFEGGVLLCCDIRHRVLRTETAYEVISSLARYSPENYKTLITKELLGQCVLTRYNNNLYRVDDIDWEKTPLSTFTLSTGEDITFLEYYKKQYNLQIKDLKQPLLINKPKNKRRDEKITFICLVPELCHLTGLTDEMRKDMRVMKEIATYTRVTPAQRHLGFKKFLENLRDNSQAQTMLSEWGLKLSDEPLKLDGRILPLEGLILKNEVKNMVPPNLEWSKYLRTIGVYRGCSIRHWLLIYIKKDSNLAHSFWNTLSKVGPGLGIVISDPTLIPIGDDRIDSYITAVRKNMDANIQIVVCLCPTPRDDRYSAIKKLCCRDIPIPSQIVNCSTIMREKRMQAVVQNIALQMNNKLGGASWAIHIPLKNTMICGIDSYHSADRKGCSVGAFVASVNKDFTKWFSKTCIQEPKQELVDGLVCCFGYGLKKYLEINTVLPERIIVFRDGVGDGQLPIVQNYEIIQFLETCEEITKSYRPKFSFIVVQKRINTKFYQFSNGSNIGHDELLENPKPGSILDHTVTRRNYYDFFLVSQFVSCGTATPSHYIVLYDTSELKPDLMQRLTYKCCHLYYNWAGTIRVPAPCQYAHKLAYLVGQNVKELPKAILDDKLFYL